MLTPCFKVSKVEVYDALAIERDASRSEGIENADRFQGEFVNLGDGGDGAYE